MRVRMRCTGTRSSDEVSVMEMERRYHVKSVCERNQPLKRGSSEYHSKRLLHPKIIWTKKPKSFRGYKSKLQSDTYHRSSGLGRLS